VSQVYYYLYLDAEQFFAKSYLTAGLKNVLIRVARSLSGDREAGDRIFSLQTAFGGGKTHALVALWHLAKHAKEIQHSAECADLRAALGDFLPKKVKGVAVFTNRTCDPTQGRDTPQGIHTRTMWGEIALQLGGKELYRKIEANDQARTVPQGLFVAVLRAAAPCLILLDEIADYCVGASAVEVGGTTLADQTISFTQELTDAVSQVQNVALVATLPASALEVASSEKGQELLTRLEKRFGRMSADEKPVADDEIYDVVKRRLFETLGEIKKHREVADAFLKMYDQHKNEVPAEAGRAGYKEQITKAYPFHPSLIDAFYLRWGSHPDFQRTRGVLRLLASIVGDLWQRRKNETQSQPLVLPAHIRWTVDALNAALMRYWGAAYEAVVAADVVGDRSNAALLDEEKGGDYPTEKITQGLAAAILLGSFGGQGERSGYSTKDLKLAASRPGLNWGYTDGAILGLEERAFYLHTASAGNLGKRYWFGTKPTLTKLVVQYRNQFASQDVDADIVRLLQEQTRNLRMGAATWRVLIDPAPDLPEQKSLALLIMSPADAFAEDAASPTLIASPIEKKLLELSNKCGARERHYRNTLLFLLPSPRGLSKLRSAFRETAVLEAVKRDFSSQLDEEQKNDLKGRLDSACKALSELVCAAYTQIARVDGDKIVASQLPGSKAQIADHLNEAWKHVVEGEEWVLRKVGSVALQKAGLIPKENPIRVKDAVEAFLHYTDKPMIASRDAVVQGLVQACRDKLIGIGRGLSPDKLQRKWCGEDVMLDPNEDGVWIIPPFEKEAAPGREGESAPTSLRGEQQPPTGAATLEGKITTIRISGGVPVENWADIFRSFVSPAARMDLQELKLGIEFVLVAKPEKPLDADHPTVKALVESARQLGLHLKFNENQD
jgi:Protein of unknown function (DUF499)